jgi:ubiquinone/menaquinone biosynthesis C-methylase UbiE
MAAFTVSGADASAEFCESDQAEIANIAAEYGWRTAAHDYMRLRSGRAYRFAVDEYGAHARFLLPLVPGDRVLQMRCGWGALAFNLATGPALVVAVDDRQNQLRFASARRKADGLATLRMLQGDFAGSLPFVDGAFDAVVLSDLVNQSVQQRTLREAHRVIRPGGRLLLSVDNPIGRWFVSYWSLGARLWRAGFREIQFYAPLPSTRAPYIIAPLGRAGVMDYLLRIMFMTDSNRARIEALGLGSAFRWARLAWRWSRNTGLLTLVRFVVPGYCVLARAT